MLVVWENVGSGLAGLMLGCTLSTRQSPAVGLEAFERKELGEAHIQIFIRLLQHRGGEATRARVKL